MGLATPTSTTQKRTRAEPVPGFATQAFLDHVTEGLGEALMGYALVVRDADGKRLWTDARPVCSGRAFFVAGRGRLFEF